jgi:hypothetical protein
MIQTNEKAVSKNDSNHSPILITSPVKNWAETERFVIRLISTVISFCLVLGVCDALFDVTLKMAGLAAYAHQHDQLSYARFTRAMFGAKARKPVVPSPTPSPAESH